MKKIKVYGYLGFPRTIIATTSQTNAINKISIKTRSSKNWIKERINETGNRDEIRLALANPEIALNVEDQF